MGSYRMDRAEIIDGLRMLGEIARERGRVVDIAVYGGAAITLAWEFRASTRDVDAVAVDAKDGRFLREAAAKVAEIKGLEPDWINDAVKGFIHDKQELEELPVFSSEENCGIRVFVPSAEYMLAMKCMAMRLDEPQSRDAEDIGNLLAELGIREVDVALDIVRRYYPDGVIAPKVRFGLEEIIEQRGHEKAPQSGGDC